MINVEELKIAVGDLDMKKVQELIDELKATGGEGAADALTACQDGMSIVGSKYESGEYFVADLIFAGDLMSKIAGELNPFLAGKGSKSLGKVVLCTVKADLHDIGKNIVKALLEADGIEVIDLGIDVSPEKIALAVKENDAKVLALSGVLTVAIDSMKKTVDYLDAEGLRGGIKVIIGGTPVTADTCKLIGADAWTLNAAKGVEICREWLAN